MARKLAIVLFLKRSTNQNNLPLGKIIFIPAYLIRSMASAFGVRSSMSLLIVAIFFVF